MKANMKQLKDSKRVIGYKMLSKLRKSGEHDM